MLPPAARRVIVSLPASFALLRHPHVLHGTRRLISTAPLATKSRSWKSSALRWGLAIGGVYYYNISNIFAEEVLDTSFRELTDEHEGQEERQPSTIEAIGERKRQAKTAAEARENARAAAKVRNRDAQTESESSKSSDPTGIDPPQTAQEYEDEADSQGAFNPETGEINWDCPCLGGMAHGPCGENFRAAFSCFVFSKEEPKGMDCIDKFKSMQDCFRRFPDVYGAELEDDEDGPARDEEGGADDVSPEAGGPPSSNLPPTNTTGSSSLKPSTPSSTGYGEEKVNSATLNHTPVLEDDGARKGIRDDTKPKQHENIEVLGGSASSAGSRT